MGKCRNKYIIHYLDRLKQEASQAAYQQRKRLQALMKEKAAAATAAEIPSADAEAAASGHKSVTDGKPFVW